MVWKSLTIWILINMIQIKKKNLDSKFDGIVFIGDFTDAQHIYRSLVCDGCTYGY